jgi:hypothetical protein
MLHGGFSMPISTISRQHFDGVSTSRRFAGKTRGMITAANDVDDLQRGIQLAFAVPESHVASAIGYLLGDGPASDKFSDEIATLFEPLSTPEGWALCADLLKIRLELRAGKLRQTRDVDVFYKLLKSGRG